MNDLWIMSIPIGWLAVMWAWFTLRVRHVRRLLGFAVAWPADAGEILRMSDWGTAYINGVGFGGPLSRLIECEHGWVVHVRTSMGYLWLPRTGTYIVRFPPQGWLRRRKCCGLFGTSHQIHVYGRLAQFAGAPASPTHARF